MLWSRIRWRNYSIRTKTRIAVLLPMMALLLSCVLVAWVSSQHEEAHRWVIHTLQVRLTLASFERQFSVVEASLKSDAQQPSASTVPSTTTSSMIQARKTLSEVQKLTADNQNQQRRISELNSLFGEYTIRVDGSLDVPLATSKAQAQALSIRIEGLATEMDEEEIRLLSSRTDRSGKWQNILSFVIDGTLLVGILGTLLATNLLSGNVSRRIAQLVESSILMGEGFPVKTLDSSHDEIGRLASTLAQTSRVLAERAAEIAESNWKLESVLRAATSASIIAEDVTGRISLFSAGATRLLGYRAEEVMGRNLAAVVQGGSATAGQKARSNALVPGADPKGEPNEYDTVYLRKDGVPLHVHVSSTPLKDISGKYVGRLHLAQDITPRKLLEEELRNKIEMSGQEKQVSSDTDENDAVDLPDWIKRGRPKDLERLSSNVRALNDWSETQGYISNPHEEKVEDKPRILIVDDFEPTRFLLRAYLQDEGYQLDLATNGKEALEEVAKRPYDLILMDVEMPQMDGYEAATRIRRWEESRGTSAVPIVALSAQNQDRSDTAAVWSSYIQKPVSKGQLLDEVKRFVEVNVTG